VANVVYVGNASVTVELLRFPVLTVKSMDSIIFWDEKPLSSIAVYSHLREMYCLWKQADNSQSSASTRLNAVT
jgi:hypothetical protein